MVFFQRLRYSGKRGNMRIIGSIAIIIVTLAVVGALFVLPEKKTSKLAEVPFTPPERVVQETEEVLGAEDIAQAGIVLAERSVVAVDSQGNNAYQYAFYLSNFSGSQRFTFARKDDLQYEAMQIIEGRFLAVYDETGAATKSVLTIQGANDGEASDVFVPPYQKEKPVYSDNGQFVAFLRVDDTGNEVMVVRSLADAVESTFSSTKIDDEVFRNGFLRPLAFTTDASEIYVQVIVDTSSAVSPYALYSFDVHEGTVREVFRQGVDPVQTEYWNLVGVYPDLNVALLESIDQALGNTLESAPARAVFAAHSLTDATQSEWFQYENVASPLANIYSPLSPDRAWLAVESLDQEHPGVLLWNVQEKAFQRVSENGTFLAWSPDSAYMLLESLSFDADGAYELLSLHVPTGKMYTILSQNSLSEGTGLNQVGDSFQLFLGLATDLSTG